MSGACTLTGGWVCLLYSTFYWSLLHLTLSGVLLEIPLESSSLDPLWILLYSIFLWSLYPLTLSGVFFTPSSTGVFFT